MTPGRHRRATRPSTPGLPDRPRTITAVVLVTLAGFLAPAALSSTAAAPQAGLASFPDAADRRGVRVVLAVEGCDDCGITPVQTTARGEVTYRGRTLRPTDGEVRYTLPRHRFASIGFVVDPSFRTVTPLGPDYPVMAVTQFRGRAPGTTVDWSWAASTRTVSGCLPGPSALDGDVFANTLVVRRVRVDGQPRAAAYLERTVRSAPYWTSVRRASKPLTEAAICA